MPRADKEIKSISTFSAKSQNSLLTATGPIGLAVSTHYLAIRCKRSHGCDVRLTLGITTIRGSCGTRTGTNCAAIVSMNGCLLRFATMPIDTGRNLALLLSDNYWVINSCRL